MDLINYQTTERTKINYFSRTDVKKDILPAYLVLLVYLLFYLGWVWMSICTLIVIILQFGALGSAYYGKDVLVAELDHHKKEAASARTHAILSIIGLMVLDAFPFYCSWEWLGYQLYYEGGVFTTLYLIVLYIFLVLNLCFAYNNVNGIDSSHQEYMEQLKRKKEEADAEQRRILREEKKKKEEMQQRALCIKQLGDDVIKLRYYTNEYNFFDDCFTKDGESHKAEIIFSKDYTHFYCEKKLFKDKQILDYKVLENTITYNNGAISTTSVDTGNMLKRAVIGGVLTGGVGAVVGAATANRNTTQGTVLSKTVYQIELTLDDAEFPVVNLYFHENKQLLKSVERVLYIILKRNNEAEASVPASSVADELIKLKQLKDEGILTEEEFNTQKKRILG